jgi:RNA polymerase sigma-70 factor, ECF subfamily
MNSAAEKHQKTIDESITRLLSRASSPRSLEIGDLRQRIFASVEKYVFGENETAASAEIREFIDALNADDLCLIAACERGDEAAWNDLVKNFDSTVKSAARKIASNSEDAEDLASSIWAELYGLKEKDGVVKGKLGYYSGRGSLAGWLRAVVSQLAVDQFRKVSRFVQIEEAREFENLAQDSAEHSENSQVVHTAENPEEVLSRTEAQRDVSNAIKQAVASLEAEDRLIMKLYYFDDLKLKDIGATLGFHEATASRKLVRIQTEIRKSVEKILCEKHGWQKEEVKRYLAETASKLDLSVEKLFGWLIIAALMQEFWR